MRKKIVSSIQCCISRETSIRATPSDESEAVQKKPTQNILKFIYSNIKCTCAESTVLARNVGEGATASTHLTVFMYGKSNFVCVFMCMRVHWAVVIISVFFLSCKRCTQSFFTIEHIIQPFFMVHRFKFHEILLFFNGTDWKVQVKWKARKYSIGGNGYLHLWLGDGRWWGRERKHRTSA